MLPCSQLFQCSRDLGIPRRARGFCRVDLKLLRCLGLVSCLLTLEHPLPGIEHSICCVASLLVSWSSNQSTSRHRHTCTANVAGPSQSPCTLHTGRIETERQVKKFKDSRTPHASSQWVAISESMVLYIDRFNIYRRNDSSLSTVLGEWIDNDL